MSNPLLVGVDVHRKTNTVCVIDSQGQELLPRFTMDNNHPGTEAFVQHMAGIYRTQRRDSQFNRKSAK